MRRYSRLITIQEKRHRRQAVLWIFLTIVLLGVLLFWGIPTLAKFSVFLSDLKNNKSTPSQGDKIAPAPPIFSIIENAINKPQIKITGTGEPKSKLILFHNGERIEVQIGEDGTFSYEATLVEGDNSFSGKVQDEAGNESQNSKEYMVKYDNTPPDLEVIETKDGETFQGAKEQNLTLKIKTNEGATVKVNERLATESVDAALGSNEYLFQTKLAEGTNSFNIKARDEAGNETEKTITVTFFP